MQHLAAQVFGGIMALVAVVALMSGPDDAAAVATKAMRTVGITIGAVVHGIPDGMDGFKETDTGGGNDRTVHRHPRQG